MLATIFLFAVLLRASAITFDAEKYVNADLALPKCCPPEEHLRDDNGTLFCETPTALYNLGMNPSSFSNYSSNCEEACVDLLVNDTRVDLVRPGSDCNSHVRVTDYVKYPKCCPLLHAYDPLEHKCVKNESVTMEKRDGLIIKTDLSQCRSSKIAIIDYLDEKSVEIDKDRGVTLRNGKKFTDGNYCLDVNSVTGGVVVRTCQDFRSACKTTFDDDKPRCLKKCCPDGQIYAIKGRGPACKITYDEGININISTRIKHKDEQIFGVIQSDKERKYRSTPKHLYYVDVLGNLQILQKERWRLYTADKAIYCVEYFSTGKGPSQQLEFLFVVKDQEIEFEISLILLSVSCVFLFLTIACYAMLPEMQNLFGKLVMVYCSVAMVAFAFLAYVKDSSRATSDKSCIVIGFLISFCMLACFTWLNIICYDMWTAFGKIRVLTLYNKRKEWKRLMYYSFYGFGLPTVVVLLTLIVYKTKCLPEYLVPHIGVSKCFFDKNSGTYDHLLFFVLPMTVLIVANCTLFVKTIIYCFKVKDEINRMKSTPNSDKAKRKRTFNTDKEKLSMLLKLFVLMGVSWLFEIFSTSFDFKTNVYLEYTEMVWDSFNALQGVFIFIIFICKKKVFVSLRNKLLGQKTRRHSESSTTMTSMYTHASPAVLNGTKVSELRNSAA